MKLHNRAYNCKSKSLSNERRSRPQYCHWSIVLTAQNLREFLH